MTPQESMKAKLTEAGIPARDIRCYGRQIVVTCGSEGASRRWAALVAQFARFRSVVQSWDDKPGHQHVKVWRVFAAVEG